MRLKLSTLLHRTAWWFRYPGFRLLKRLLDIAVSATALVLLAPLFLVLAILIRRDGGPVFYWQTRVGLYGREFPFPKFRSMIVNADSLKDELLEQNDHEDSVTFKMKDDPRITPVGKFIRRFSLDEFPQFWCVLKGDMSLVGPRPPVPREVVLYTLEERQRLNVLPGLTCIWQVEGRGEIPFPQQVKMDMDYIFGQSLGLDLNLLFKTVPAVLGGKGAY
jgi:lipopolysaccharide/colanic/teichoic acid biosynthesis glycosyltransferase